MMLQVEDTVIRSTTLAHSMCLGPENLFDEREIIVAKRRGELVGVFM